MMKLWISTRSVSIRSNYSRYDSINNSANSSEGCLVCCDTVVKFSVYFLWTVAWQHRLTIRRSVWVWGRVWAECWVSPAIPAVCTHQLGAGWLGWQVQPESTTWWCGGPRGSGRWRCCGPAWNFSQFTLRRPTEERQPQWWPAFCIRVASHRQQRCHLSR